MNDTAKIDIIEEKTKLYGKKQRKTAKVFVNFNVLYL